jgi:hypothetical protein
MSVFLSYSQVMVRLRVASLVVAAVAVSALSLGASAAQAEWLSPVDISEAGDHAASPHVALDSEGNATAVWDRSREGETVVETSFRPAGEGWEAPEVLAEGASPQVVVDRNGNWTVIWERSAFPQMVIETASRAPGGNWSAAAEVDAVPLAADPEPWLAVDWEGRNTAVWKDGEMIMSSYRQFPGEWEEPVPLSEGESFVPQAAMDARGDATAVWMHYDGSHFVVESSYRPEQGEWGEATLVSAPGEEGGNPHVAIDAQGDSLVVWRGEDEGETRLRAAYRPAGGEWGEAVDVSAAGEQIESPRAAVDPQGNAIAVWSGSSGELGGYDIAHASFKPVGGEWEEPVALSAEGGNAFPSDVVFDESGNAAVIWERWDGTTNLVQVAYRPADEEWEPAVDLSEAGKQGMDARVVLDAPGSTNVADGDATAVWVSAASVPCPEEEAGPCSSYVVQAAGYDPDGLPEVELEAPLEGVVGEEVEIATPTAGLYAPTLEFGDGEGVAATAALHVYDAAGEYELTAAGAEELGYRASARRTIKIVADPSELGSGGGPEGEKPTPGPEGGQPGSAPGASSGGSGAPPQAASPAASDSCEAASAARAAAARALKKVTRKLAAATGAKERRRLTAAKRKRRVALRQAEDRLTAAC